MLEARQGEEDWKGKGRGGALYFTGEAVAGTLASWL